MTLNRTGRLLVLLSALLMLALLGVGALAASHRIDDAGRAKGRAAIVQADPGGRANVLATDISTNPLDAHSPTVQRFGFCHWRAVCGDQHASTGGNVWVGPKRLTSGGAGLDGSQHWAGYQP